ncbi:MAG: hypothetical protein K9J13_08520 [Saprospiraceae bacterium]|nr:hypothetical protein [Saprospiraceae bacterium]
MKRFNILFAILVVIGMVYSCKKEKPITVNPNWVEQNVTTDSGFSYFSNFEIIDNEYFVLGYVNGQNYWRGTYIYKSNDQGSNWSKMNYFDTIFGGIGFIDHNIGFLCTGDLNSNRYILKTIDKGINWDTISIGWFTFHDFYSLGINKNFAFGNGGVFLSTDIGNTWQNVLSSSYAIRTIDFANNMIGYGANTYGYIYKTNDGGKNWIQINSMSEVQFYQLDFYNENKGIAIVEDSRDHSIPKVIKLLFTIDGGMNWVDMNVESNIIKLTGSCRLCFKSENEIYLGANGIFYTNDFGNNWTTQYSLPRFESITDLKISGNIGIAASANKILKCNNLP